MAAGRTLWFVGDEDVSLHAWSASTLCGRSATSALMCIMGASQHSRPAAMGSMGAARMGRRHRNDVDRGRLKPRAAYSRKNSLSAKPIATLPEFVYRQCENAPARALGLRTRSRSESRPDANSASSQRHVPSHPPRFPRLKGTNAFCDDLRLPGIDRLSVVAGASVALPDCWHRCCGRCRCRLISSSFVRSICPPIPDVGRRLLW